jgi:hypothetical protein
MTLFERIRQGEKAIAAAKSQGRDVRDWEAHLEMLKRQAVQFTDTTAPYSLADLMMLRGKDEKTLAEIHQVKIVFNGGRVLQ